MGPIEYNKRLSFGTISTTTNPNTGGPVRAFVPKFTVWGQIRRRTMANNYSVIANGLTDTQDVVIRHNKAVNDSLLVVMDNERYEIKNVSPDETQGFNKQDILTVQKVKKTGK